MSNRWKIINSNGFKKVILKKTSFDDSFLGLKETKLCPICLSIIWNKDEFIKCHYCSQDICSDCISQIERISNERNSRIKCPFCRNSFYQDSIDYHENQPSFFIMCILGTCYFVVLLSFSMSIVCLILIIIQKNFL